MEAAAGGEDSGAAARRRAPPCWRAQQAGSGSRLAELASATGGGACSELTGTDDLASTFKRVAEELHHHQCCSASHRPCSMAKIPSPRHSREGRRQDSPGAQDLRRRRRALCSAYHPVASRPKNSSPALFFIAAKTTLSGSEMLRSTASALTGLLRVQARKEIHRHRDRRFRVLGQPQDRPKIVFGPRAIVADDAQDIFRAPLVIRETLSDFAASSLGLLRTADEIILFGSRTRIARTSREPLTAAFSRSGNDIFASC